MLLTIITYLCIFMISDILELEVVNMGVIFDIQRLSIHDGPGLRTTVFMKGCPLHCKWCHNPEGISFKKQLQYNKELCINCELCKQVCKYDVHQFLNNNHTVKFKNCILCGNCIEQCPSQALKFFGRNYNVSQVIDILKRDIPFFGSDGGVTFSGGEATSQVDFLTELLKASTDLGISTAVDTCGYAPWPIFEKIIPYTDYFLYDIKAIDTKLHKTATGVDNDLILNNLKKLSNLNQKIYIRIPLIYEYNSNIEEIEKMANYIENLNVIAVTLMPYHVIGNSKRNLLGIDDSKVYTAPSQSDLEKYIKIFESKNIKLIK